MPLTIRWGGVNKRLLAVDAHAPLVTQEWIVVGATVAHHSLSEVLTGNRGCLTFGVRAHASSFHSFVMHLAVMAGLGTNDHAASFYCRLEAWRDMELQEFLIARPGESIRTQFLTLLRQRVQDFTNALRQGKFMKVKNNSYLHKHISLLAMRRIMW